jgi:Mn2+/Fe2+ NRAMP family transporter
MERRCAGVGLLLAGTIVTLIGLAIALRVTFEVPRHWTVFMVGVAILVLGGVRRWLGDGRGDVRKPGTGSA